MDRILIVGIDSGSSAAAVVALDKAGRLVAKSSGFHRGRLADCLRTVLGGRMAEMECLHHLHPEARNLIVVGAERFARVSFDSEGRYSRLRRSSFCAADFADLAMREGASLTRDRCTVFMERDLTRFQGLGYGRGERNRPKVAFFGDLYSRDNDVLNQGLEKTIEEAGAR